MFAYCHSRRNWNKIGALLFLVEMTVVTHAITKGSKNLYVEPELLLLPLVSPHL